MTALKGVHMAGKGQYGSDGTTAGQYGRDLMADAAEVKDSVVETVSEVSQNAGENVKRMARNAAEGVQQTTDYFRSNGVQKISEDLLDYAKANPTHAMVGAAVAGFVLGRLVSSRQ
jgi:ElaB/YqjD/DUF883 family membrane-anchored ribosome-binding protein